MTFLIDGYNLMHAIGLASKRMSAKKFESKRGEFLDWLAKETTGRGVEVRVVFDAQQAVMPSAESVHKGLRVRFAYRQTADDVIESLVVQETHAAKMTVISNDTRIQAAAKHAGCGVMSCESFNDWLLARQPPPASHEPPAPEKPDGPTPAAEIDELLNIFSQPRPKRRT